MLRYLVIVLNLLAISAFIPSSEKIKSPMISSSTVLLMSTNDFRSAVGAQPPLGFWDPLGLLKNADQERFDRLRTVELKHGRISMLAILGHLITTAGGRLPGDIAYGLPFASMKNGLAAFETIPVSGSVQIVSIII